MSELESVRIGKKEKKEKKLDIIDCKITGASIFFYYYYFLFQERTAKQQSNEMKSIHSCYQEPSILK